MNPLNLIQKLNFEMAKRKNLQIAGTMDYVSSLLYICSFTKKYIKSA